MNQSILNRSRSDKFSFILDLPNALKESQDSILQKQYNANQVQFTTFGSPVPEIKIPELKVPFGGQVYNASSLSRPPYPPINLKFLVDNGYQNYWILWKWLNLFNESENSFSDLTSPLNENTKNIFLTKPMSDFTSTFSLFALDEFNNKIIEFKYTEAFITGLSPIDYSFQTSSEITCTATFVFNQLNVRLLKDINVPNC